MKSDLIDKMKRSFFQAAVVSILLYRCTTAVWTLTKRLEKKLDGNYTRMLRAVLNKSWLTKAWTAIDRLMIIWKSDLTDKMKHNFFLDSGFVNTAVWIHHLDAYKTAGEEAITQE